MKKNSNKVERVIRMLVGAAVLSLAFIGPKTPLGYLGVIPLITGLTGFCPLYTIFGINTCPTKKLNSGSEDLPAESDKPSA